MNGGRPTLRVAIRNPQSTIGNHFGVVAQLVEHHNGIVGGRGSNPLGSRLRSRRRGERRLSRRDFSEGGHLFTLQCQPSELRLGKPTSRMAKFSINTEK